MDIQRFLIVDESDATALMWTMLLQDLGYKTVIHAKTGFDALAKAKEHNIQFMITAWEMSAMPGTVFIQKAKQELNKRYMPFLIYSHRLGQEDVRLLKELGHQNVLPAPIDKTAAKEMISGIIKTETTLPPEEVRLRKIENYFFAGKVTDALKLFDGKLRKKGPWFVRAQVLLGRIWISSAQWKKAEEALKLALEEDKENFDARSLMANALSGMGRSEEALAMLRQMSDSSPKNIQALLNLGNAYVDADQHDKAKETFGKIDLLDPDNKAVNDEKAKLAFKEGDMSLAARLIAETQNGDMLARHFNNVAIGMVHKKEYDKALDIYKNAISILSDRARLHALHYNMGLALTKKGDHAAAMNAYLASYRAYPAFEKSYAAMAKAAAALKEAGQTFDQNIVREANHIRKMFKESQGKQDAA